MTRKDKKTFEKSIKNGTKRTFSCELLFSLATPLEDLQALRQAIYGEGEQVTSCLIQVGKDGEVRLSAPPPRNGDVTFTMTVN